MIAAVTGGTGFLGRHLVRHLLAQGFEVRCLVRNGSGCDALRQFVSPDRTDRLNTCVGSLERPSSWRRALDSCDVLFHVAASLRGSVPALFLSNVVGTRLLFEEASRANVRRTVLVSSIAVHAAGRAPKESVIDETCPLDPEPHRRDAYTYSKVAQEQAAWTSYTEGKTPLVVVRPGVIYGPGRDCMSGRVGLTFGELLIKMGDQRLPYTFVENCARAILLAGTVEGIEGEAFNIVDDGILTSNSLLNECRRRGRRWHVLPIPEWAVEPMSRLCHWYSRWSGGQIPDVLTPYKSAAMWKPMRYSNAKAKSVLGWQPTVTFASGLRQALCATGQRRTA